MTQRCKEPWCNNPVLTVDLSPARCDKHEVEHLRERVAAEKREHVKMECALSNRVAKVERERDEARAQLKRARELICSAMCGKTLHHPQCIALDGGSESEGGDDDNV